MIARTTFRALYAWERVLRSVRLTGAAHLWAPAAMLAAEAAATDHFLQGRGDSGFLRYAAAIAAGNLAPPWESNLRLRNGLALAINAAGKLRRELGTCPCEDCRLATITLARQLLADARAARCGGRGDHLRPQHANHSPYMVN